MSRKTSHLSYKKLRSIWFNFYMKLLLIAIVCFWGWSHDPTRQFVSGLLYKAADAVEPGTSKTNKQTIGERIDTILGN